MPSLSPYMPYQYIPDALRGCKMQQFTYDIAYVANSPNAGGAVLAASAPNQSASTSIQADAYFLLISLAGIVSATDESTVDANPRVLIKIQDSGTSQALSDYPVDWTSMVGTGQNPFFLPYPRIFAPNATVTTYLTNLVATAKNARIAFQGFKIYAPIGAYQT